jgi:hypothetical protein
MDNINIIINNFNKLNIKNNISDKYRLHNIKFIYRYNKLLSCKYKPNNLLKYKNVRCTLNYSDYYLYQNISNKVIRNYLHKVLNKLYIYKNSICLEASNSSVSIMSQYNKIQFINIINKLNNIFQSLNYKSTEHIIYKIKKLKIVINILINQ